MSVPIDLSVRMIYIHSTEVGTNSSSSTTRTATRRTRGIFCKVRLIHIFVRGWVGDWAKERVLVKTAHRKLIAIVPGRDAGTVATQPANHCRIERRDVI